MALTDNRKKFTNNCFRKRRAERYFRDDESFGLASFFEDNDSDSDEAYQDSLSIFGLDLLFREETTDKMAEGDPATADEVEIGGVKIKLQANTQVAKGGETPMFKK